MGSPGLFPWVGVLAVVDGVVFAVFALMTREGGRQCGYDVVIRRPQEKQASAARVPQLFLLLMLPVTTCLPNLLVSILLYIVTVTSFGFGHTNLSFDELYYSSARTLIPAQTVVWKVELLILIRLFDRIL